MNYLNISKENSQFKEYWKNQFRRNKKIKSIFLTLYMEKNICKLFEYSEKEFSIFQKGWETLICDDKPKKMQKWACAQLTLYTGQCSRLEHAGKPETLANTVKQWYVASKGFHKRLVACIDCHITQLPRHFRLRRIVRIVFLPQIAKIVPTPQ